MVYNNSANINPTGLVRADGSGGFNGVTTTQYGVQIGAASNGLTSQLLTNGQLIIGSTGVAPVAATLTAGSGISVTNAAGSITIAATGSGLSWTTVAAASQTIAANNGYVVGNGAGLVTFTLPVTAAVGDTFIIMGRDAGGWTIAQGAGQQMLVGSLASTAGVGGTVSSTNQYDNATIICITANTLFAVAAGAGVLDVV